MLARIDAVAAKLQDRFGPPPEVAIVLGSGLGGFAAGLGDRRVARYAELGIPDAGVAGHAGELVLGTVGDHPAGGRRVACFSGRLHLYEGHSAADVVLGIRAIARWGVKGVILTSAVGGIEPSLRPGDVMVITDHISFLGESPLRGRNIDALGTRFPDLSRLYSPRLREIARAAAGASLREGVYAAMPGPSYETPAEIRMLHRLGADVVGMSLVPEAVAAGHAGLEVLAISVVANLAAGLSEGALAHSDVTAEMHLAGARVARLLEGVVARW